MTSHDRIDTGASPRPPRRPCRRNTGGNRRDGQFLTAAAARLLCLDLLAQIRFLSLRHDPAPADEATRLLLADLARVPPDDSAVSPLQSVIDVADRLFPGLTPDGIAHARAVMGDDELVDTAIAAVRLVLPQLRYAEPGFRVRLLTLVGGAGGSAGRAAPATGRAS